MLLVTLCFGSSVAHAYNLYYVFNVTGNTKIILWPGASVAMTIDTDAFPPGSAAHDEIVRAIEAWDKDNIPGSGLGVTWGDATQAQLDRGFSLSDEVSMVTLVENSIGNGGLDALGVTCDFADGAVEPAKTHLRRNKLTRRWQIIEADTVVNGECEFPAAFDYFDVDDGSARQQQYSLEQLLVHEMGHAIGLNHEDGDSSTTAGETYRAPTGEVSQTGVTWRSWPRTMATLLDGGSAIGDPGLFERQYGVNEDDRQGVRFLYPTTGNDGIDVAVQSYTVPDVDYDKAGPCDILVNNRARPSPAVDLTTSCPADYPGTTPATPLLPPLTVRRGAAITVDFSLLNLGNQTVTTDYSYVLRRLVVNGPEWTILSGRTSLQADTPFEKTATVRLPSSRSLEFGDYAISLVVDPSDTLDELGDRAEDNNEATWNRIVRIVP